MYDIRENFVKILPEHFMASYYVILLFRSYGVLIWEVFTYAQIPYSSYSNSDVLAFVRSGGRLEQPCACPEQL